jgi:hypothetical protein
MSEQPKERKKAAAQQRLASALRDNLKRRKAQTRGRKEEAKDEARPHDSAGIDAEK